MSMLRLYYIQSTTDAIVGCKYDQSLHSRRSAFDITRRIHSSSIHSNFDPSFEIYKIVDHAHNLIALVPISGNKVEQQALT